MAPVELRNLTKRYGAHAAVDDVSLTIAHGRLVCLLGPSGCGKTTTLRLIAGFVEPSAGEIRVGERLVSSPGRTLPPEQRNMSMIFQSYALWPHMTVADNVAYGLKLRKLDRDTIARKLKAILTTTHLEALAERYPGEHEETLTYFRLPLAHRKHMKSTNMLERLNEEIRRRTYVVRIFPNAESCLRLVRALTVERHEAWLEDHRYLNMDLLKEYKKEALRQAA